MPESNNRVAITVAIVGVIGTIGAALIGNWEKFFPAARGPTAQNTQPPAATVEVASNPARALARQEEPRPTRQAEPPPANSTPAIAGLWQDSNAPGSTTQVVQCGNSFRFNRTGFLPNGVRFESSGTGTIHGARGAHRYTARYQTGETSVGDCTGAVSPDSLRMDLSCSDSALGVLALTALRR